MKNQVFFISLLVLIFAEVGLASDVRAFANLEGDTFNFELTGRKNWDYDLKRTVEKGQHKVRLYVKDLSDDAISGIKNIENPMVSSIKAVKNAVDNKWMIEFTLKGNDVETFDYLTDQPSKLIVDFYRIDPSPDQIKPAQKTLKTNVKNQSSTQSVSGSTEANKNSKTEDNQKSANRKPAEADVLLVEKVEDDSSFLSRAGLYDASDSQFSRFTMKTSEYKEESVIRAMGNYYLKFPVLESEFSFWNKMKENSPAYEIKPENNDENKQARLLVTLFNKKRFLVFLQTVEWFKSKFPNSKYLELVSYMTGDAFTELWRKEKIETLYEQAQNAYREALEKYPDSDLAERTSLYTGMLAVEKADQMSAIRKLRVHIDNKKYDGKVSQHYAKIGLAYSFSKINKLEDAFKFLNEIESRTKDESVLAEVAVRRGDFNYNSKRLKEAVEAYDSAIKKFQIVSKRFPSAYFNKMEAQFRLARFQDSHMSALGFAQNFPSHEYAPYALTRVGELLDIMGADQSKAVGAFLETHFRYGDSPKTIVARLHLLSTRMKSMKSEELEQTLQKMDELTQKSDLENIDQFKVAMLADGFSRRKDYLRAIDILSKFYQLNPTRPDAKQVTRRIAKNINDQLKLLSVRGEYPELLKTYRKYSDTWLKTYPRIDTDYFLGLAYENAGAYSDAIQKYEKVLTEMNTIKGSAAEKEIYVTQYLPTFDALHLKIAKAQYDNGAPQQSYQYLQKIEKPMGLSQLEQVDRVYLASQLSEKKGDIATAIRYLSELSLHWSGQEELLIPTLLRLGDLHKQINQTDKAIESFDKCRKIIASNPNTEEKHVVQLLNSYGHLLNDNKKKDEAISVMSEIISKFENKYKLNQEKFFLGNLHYEKGEIKNAERAWARLEDEGSNLWKRLSQDKLRQSAWDVEYRKHLKRIPAMSQVEEQK